MSFSKGRRNSTIIWMGLAVGSFWAATLPRLGIPLAEWDHVILSTAEDWSAGVLREWRFDHPPLYPALLSMVFRAFGPGVAAARAMNGVFVLLTALGVYRFASKAFSCKAAFWAFIVYLLNPVVIQGVSSLDMADTSVLPFLFVLTAMVHGSPARPASRTPVWVAGLLWGLCLWAKITATVAWMAALAAGAGLFALLGPPGSIKRMGARLAAGILLGGAAYAASSYLILNGLWGAGAFRYPLESAWAAAMDRTGAEGSFAILPLLYSAARITLWFSPYLLLVFLAALKDLAAEPGDRAADAYRFRVWMGSSVLVYGFSLAVIGGTNWGYPRYHAPVFPIVAAFCGHLISKSTPMSSEKTGWVAAGAAAALSVLAAAVLPDPIFFLSIPAKELFLRQLDPLQVMLRSAAVLLPFYGLPLAGSFWLWRSRAAATTLKPWGMTLAVGLFATTLSVNLLQAAAPYRTTVQYGASGKEELLESVRRHLTFGDFVLAAPEFIYELRGFSVPPVEWEDLRSPERFQRFVSRNAPAAIIGGLTVSSIDQLHWMLGPETAAFLATEYRFYRVGTYFYWLRTRSGPGPSIAELSVKRSRP